MLKSFKSAPITHTIAALFAYAGSPFVHTAAAGAIDFAAQKGDVNADFPRMLRSSIVNEATFQNDELVDMTGLLKAAFTNPLEYWRAQTNPAMDECVPLDEAATYDGAASWGMIDNIPCLSELTGIALEDMEPTREDYFEYRRYHRCDVLGPCPMGAVE